MAVQSEEMAEKCNKVIGSFVLLCKRHVCNNYADAGNLYFVQGMIIMNPIFVEILNEIFINQFIVEADEHGSFIKFPAKNTDFGDILICEEYPGSYIVIIGIFTHSHFDCYDGAEEEQIKEAVNDIIDFLKNLFTDRIVCHGSHKGGGGWYLKGSCEEKIFDDGTDNLFVWSGIFKKAQHI